MTGHDRARRPRGPPCPHRPRFPARRKSPCARPRGFWRTQEMFLIQEVAARLIGKGLDMGTVLREML